MRERKDHPKQLLQKLRRRGLRDCLRGFIPSLTDVETEAHRGHSAKWPDAPTWPHPLLVQGQAILGSREG